MRGRSSTRLQRWLGTVGRRLGSLLSAVLLLGWFLLSPASAAETSAAGPAGGLAGQGRMAATARPPGGRVPDRGRQRRAAPAGPAESGAALGESDSNHAFRVVYVPLDVPRAAGRGRLYLLHAPAR